MSDKPDTSAEVVERFYPDIERGSNPDYDDPIMRSSPTGGFVRYSDHQALLAERDALQRLLNAERYDYARAIDERDKARATSAEMVMELARAKWRAEDALHSLCNAIDRAKDAEAEVTRLRALLDEVGTDSGYAAGLEAAASFVTSYLSDAGNHPTAIGMRRVFDDLATAIRAMKPEEKT